jgi:hypothetical protein
MTSCSITICCWAQDGKNTIGCKVIIVNAMFKPQDELSCKKVCFWKSTLDQKNFKFLVLVIKKKMV